MIVFSAFDGLGGARVALDRLPIPVDNYYASEIDKYGIQIAQKNYPTIKQVGDIRTYKDTPDVDLLIGGFPCQNISRAGNMEGVFGDRSSLLFELLRLRDSLQPTYWLFENVPARPDILMMLNHFIGCEPVEINSNLFSAQNRRRLYWTNIPIPPLPTACPITFGDIREKNADISLYYTDKGIDYLLKYDMKWYTDDLKIYPLVASLYHRYGRTRNWVIEDTYGLRFISYRECERAQNLPDDYTEGVSGAQRYKLLGNGFTVNVIRHILRGLI